MSHTYRNVYDDRLDEINEKKIKRVDKKHHNAIITDGAFKHGITDDDGCYYDTPKQKKQIKKISKRKNRKYNYEED